MGKCRRYFFGDNPLHLKKFMSFQSSAKSVKNAYKFLPLQIDRYSHQARLVKWRERRRQDSNDFLRKDDHKTPARLDNKLVHQSRSLKIHFEVNFRYNPDQRPRKESALLTRRFMRKKSLYYYQKIKPNMFVVESKVQAAIFSVLSVASISHWSFW